MELIWMLVALIAALVVGWIIGFQMGDLNHAKPVGTLHIETSDPDGPYLFTELGADPRTFSHCKYVTFKVSTESYISQE